MKLTCNICCKQTISSLGKIEGFRAETFYEVFGCSFCGTNFTLPKEPDKKIYEAIYKNIDSIPGYSRYSQYAQQILKEKDPINYLIHLEDSYWGIYQTILAEATSSREDTLIWEVGCGQGYLTYGLSNAGFNAIGLDISESAVTIAKQRYGNLYFCEEVKTLFTKTNERPSFIILSEVIEHIEDPVSFISELMTYLKPSGAIIITTPNKANNKSIWDTELPPVHLWWFTKKGLEMLGESLSCEVLFTNLNEFYNQKLCFRKIIDNDLNQRIPILDKEYSLIKSNKKLKSRFISALKLILKNIIPNLIIIQIQRKIAFYRNLEALTSSSEPSTLCVMYRYKK